MQFFKAYTLEQTSPPANSRTSSLLLQVVNAQPMSMRPWVCLELKDLVASARVVKTSQRIEVVMKVVSIAWFHIGDPCKLWKMLMNVKEARQVGVCVLKLFL